MVITTFDLIQDLQTSPPDCCWYVLFSLFMEIEFVKFLLCKKCFTQLSSAGNDENSLKLDLLFDS